MDRSSVTKRHMAGRAMVAVLVATLMLGCMGWLSDASVSRADEGSGTYGFVVASTNLEKARTLHPSERAMGNIVFKNTGTSIDILELSVSVQADNHGWKATVEDTELYLAADGQAIATVTVRAPAVGRNGETAVITFTAASSSVDGRHEHIVFTSALVVQRSVSLVEPVGSLTAPPGFRSPFDVKFINEGELEETLALSVSSDWPVFISPATMVVAPGATAQAVMDVAVPSLAAEGSKVVVDIAATTSDGMPYTWPVIVEAGMEVRIELSTPVHFKNIPPGGTTEFEINVANKGRSSSDVLINLRVVEGSGEWEATLAPPSLYLKGLEEGTVTLTLKAPQGTMAGTHIMVSVEGSDEGRHVVEDVTVVGVVDPLVDVRATLEEARTSSIPGNVVHHTIKLENMGNTEEVVSFSSLVGSDWPHFEFRLGEDRVSNVLLSPGEEATLVAGLTIPIGMPVGDYQASILIADSKGAGELPVVIGVDLSSRVAMSTPSAVLEPIQRGADFDINVMNLGNGDDSIHLTVGGLPEGFDYSFVGRDDQVIQVSKNEIKEVLLAITVPRDFKGEEVPFNVTALPGNGMPSVMLLLIKVRPPDLTVSDVQIKDIDGLRPGDLAFVSATIENIGRGPAYGVTVSMELDGVIVDVKREPLNVLFQGNSYSVLFNWPVREGKHTLKVIVDPDGEIYEIDENNNAATIHKTINAAPAPLVTVESVGVVMVGCLAMTFAAAGGAASTEWGKYKLFVLFVLPLYTKLKREDVLDHFKRGEVYGYIKANPGEHYNSIKKALAMKNGTLVYHLQTLEREEFVVSVSDGRYKRFYPKGMRIPKEKDITLNRIQEIILEIINENPGITQRDIAAEVGLSGATINYHIGVMLRAKVIDVLKKGRKTHCYAIGPQSVQYDEDGHPVQKAGHGEGEAAEGHGHDADKDDDIDDDGHVGGSGAVGGGDKPH